MNPARRLAAWWSWARRPNVLMDAPTPVPWRPTAPKHELTAALRRVLAKH